MSDKGEKNLALIALCADIIRGEQVLQRMVQQLRRSTRILRISNVYKRDEPVDLRSEIVAVVQIATDANRESLQSEVSQMRTSDLGFISYGILLAFNQDVNLVPGATLPDPRFTQDPLLLQCAAEVWGDYEHPILSRNLKELVKQLSNRTSETGVEFFAQGKVLL